MFLLFIGQTKLAEIPGLSAAGADVNALLYTAVADADMLYYDRPRAAKSLPFDPQGHPSPALITRAAILEAGFPVKNVRVGTVKSPAAPHITLSCEPGRDVRFERAVPDYEQIAEAAAKLAHSSDAKQVVLGESVPGGTTTALLVLRALGYSGTVSSAGPENPISLKEKIWETASERLGITVGGFKGRGIEAAAEIGDPMQVAAASYVAALPDSVKVTLAGGTQMMAVAAILRDMGIKRDITVATTKYVDIDKTSNFRRYGAEIGVTCYAAPLDFTNSRFKGFAEYELGYIKEGVGAGGAVWYAEQLGVSVERVQARAEWLYEKMLNDGGSVDGKQ